MKKIWIVMSIAIGIYGCSLLKRNSSQSSSAAYRDEEQTELHELTEKDSTSALLTMHYERDSLQEAYTVQLWPKGRFSFSAADGFEGEAERILITGSRQQMLQQGGMQNSTSRKQEKKTTDLDQQKKLSAVQKAQIKTSKPDYRLLIGFIILLIIAWRWLQKVQIR
ncbi:hypothetical protein [Pedobacter sp. MR2016-24]|uniref:hypothetical protein n=1 Tax=Pedobacter sp. MR2016-24 TaxID=2994466 RepID=UPI002246EFA7|nr:hypothetical protein [Pedobacter sp. MR2016-24]MCX2483747.1 hypothetical protein [Pedobacter sp. MR2016-24]